MPGLSCKVDNHSADQEIHYHVHNVQLVPIPNPPLHTLFS